MRANIPTEILIREIKITNLDTDGTWIPIQVTCDILPLGIAQPQRGVTVTMSSQLSPNLKEELLKILEQDMGMAVKHLQESAEKSG